MNKTRSSISKLEYHIVWCTKYRRKVLTKHVEFRLKEILLWVSKDLRFEIKEMEADKDHIHLLISTLPHHNLVNIVKIMKGRSYYMLRKEFKDELNKYLWGDNLWSPSYFICTVSENSRKNVVNYIRNQKT